MLDPFTSDDDWSSSILQPVLRTQFNPDFKQGLNGIVSFNPEANEIEILDNDGNTFVIIKIDTDAHKNPVGVRIDGIPITTKELKAIDSRALLGNTVYYKTGPDDLKDLI